MLGYFTLFPATNAAASAREKRRLNFPWLGIFSHSSIDIFIENNQISRAYNPWHGCTSLLQVTAKIIEQAYFLIKLVTWDALSHKIK